MVKDEIVEIKRAMDFFERLFAEKPIEFLNYEEACEAYVQQQPGCGMTAQEIGENLRNAFFGTPRIISNHRRANAIYRFGIKVPVPSRGQFENTWRAQFDEEGRMWEYNQGRTLMMLGEPYPDDILEFLGNLAEESIESKTMEELCVSFIEWKRRVKKILAPTDEDYTIDRIDNVCSQDIYIPNPYTPLSMIQIAKILMMTENPVCLDFEDKLRLNGTLDLDAARRIRKFVTKEKDVVLEKEYKTAAEPVVIPQKDKKKKVGRPRKNTAARRSTSAAIQKTRLSTPSTSTAVQSTSSSTPSTSSGLQSTSSALQSTSSAVQSTSSSTPSTSSALQSTSSDLQSSSSSMPSTSSGLQTTSLWTPSTSSDLQTTSSSTPSTSSAVQSTSSAVQSTSSARQSTSSAVQSTSSSTPSTFFGKPARVSRTPIRVSTRLAAPVSSSSPQATTAASSPPTNDLTDSQPKQSIMNPADEQHNKEPAQRQQSSSSSGTPRPDPSSLPHQPSTSTSVRPSQQGEAMTPSATKPNEKFFKNNPLLPFGVDASFAKLSKPKLAETVKPQSKRVVQSSSPRKSPIKAVNRLQSEQSSSSTSSTEPHNPTKEERDDWFEFLKTICGAIKTPLTVDQFAQRFQTLYEDKTIINIRKLIPHLNHLASLETNMPVVTKVRVLFITQIPVTHRFETENPNYQFELDDDRKIKSVKCANPMIHLDRENDTDSSTDGNLDPNSLIDLTEDYPKNIEVFDVHDSSEESNDDEAREVRAEKAGVVPEQVEPTDPGHPDDMNDQNGENDDVGEKRADESGDESNHVEHAEPTSAQDYDDFEYSNAGDYDMDDSHMDVEETPSSSNSGDVDAASVQRNDDSQKKKDVEKDATTATNPKHDHKELENAPTSSFSQPGDRHSTEIEKVNGVPPEEVVHEDATVKTQEDDEVMKKTKDGASSSHSVVVDGANDVTSGNTESDEAPEEVLKKSAVKNRKGMTKDKQIIEMLQHLTDLTETIKERKPAEWLAEEYVKWKQSKGDAGPFDMDVVVEKYKESFSLIGTYSKATIIQRIKMLWLSGTRCTEEFASLIDKQGEAEVVDGKIMTYRVLFNENLDFEAVKEFKIPEEDENAPQVLPAPALQPIANTEPSSSASIDNKIDTPSTVPVALQEVESGTPKTLTSDRILDSAVGILPTSPAPITARTVPSSTASPSKELPPKVVPVGTNTEETLKKIPKTSSPAKTSSIPVPNKSSTPITSQHGPTTSSKSVSKPVVLPVEKKLSSAVPQQRTQKRSRSTTSAPSEEAKKAKTHDVEEKKSTTQNPSLVPSITEPSMLQAAEPTVTAPSSPILTSAKPTSSSPSAPIHPTSEPSTTTKPAVEVPGSVQEEEKKSTDQVTLKRGNTSTAGNEAKRAKHQDDQKIQVEIPTSVRSVEGSSSGQVVEVIKTPSAANPSTSAASISEDDLHWMPEVHVPLPHRAENGKINVVFNFVAQTSTELRQDIFNWLPDKHAALIKDLRIPVSERITPQGFVEKLLVWCEKLSMIPRVELDDDEKDEKKEINKTVRDILRAIHNKIRFDREEFKKHVDESPEKENILENLQEAIKWSKINKYNDSEFILNSMNNLYDIIRCDNLEEVVIKSNDVEVDKLE